MRRFVMIAMLAMPAIPALTQSTPASSSTEQVEAGRLTLAGRTVDYRIRRLPLASFPEIPPPVRTALEQRECMVPQTFEAHRPENVIHGEFRQKGSSDWAVLCSHDGSTSLLVFSGSAIGMPIELETHKDLDRLTLQRSTGQMGFAWGIDMASPQRVREVAGSQAGPFDHDGLEESFIDRPSEIRYYRNGMWLQFQRTE